jgi:tetratricopeptide (TPR) repeat protein
MGKPAQESRPYEHKYAAREMLQNLMAHERIKLSDEPSRAAEALIEYILGVNHFETEEITESEKHYSRCLELLLSLPGNYRAKYVNTFQDVLNALGILRCNRGENDAGMDYFNKASTLYNSLKSIHKGDFSHFFKDYLKGDSSFHFIIEGGVNPRKAEQNYTLTLFYMAQAYSKLGDKHKSASFCAETLKRQMISGDYDMKDWAINCINMAEYYVENNYMAQAVYILECGLSIVTGKRRKLRSTLNMQLGRAYRSLLELSVQTDSKKEPVPEEINVQLLSLSMLPPKFPQLVYPKDLEAAKELFKVANSHFKVALEYFVIDGYVTEHIEMKKDISALYKALCYFDSSDARVLAMLNRRLELIENFTKEINKQSYGTLWQHLMNEVCSIYLDIYEVKATAANSQKKEQKRLEKHSAANPYALTCIEKHVEMIEFISKFDMNDDSAKDIIQSCLNLMFGVARVYSKLEDVDNRVRVGYMEKSFRWYEKIHKYLNDTKSGKYSSKVPDLNEQIKICDEMIALMPLRISQVNASAPI